MSEHYKPTIHLRWARLTDKDNWVKFPALKGGYDTEHRYQLQQLWVSDIVGEEPEWRDVPIETTP